MGRKTSVFWQEKEDLSSCHDGRTLTAGELRKRGKKALNQQMRDGMDAYAGRKRTDSMNEVIENGIDDFYGDDYYEPKGVAPEPKIKIKF